jgi:hypothetical protein
MRRAIRYYSSTPRFSIPPTPRSSEAWRSRWRIAWPSTIASTSVRRESRLCDCVAWPGGLGHTCGSVRSSLSTHARPAMAACEAVETMDPDREVRSGTARCTPSCQHQGGSGARLGGMTNQGEPAINLVKAEQAQGADKPGPKGRQSVAPLHVGSTRTSRLPGESWGRNHRVTQAEHGKPVSPPRKRQADRKGGPRGCGQEISEGANAGR